MPSYPSRGNSNRNKLMELLYNSWSKGNTGSKIWKHELELELKNSKEKQRSRLKRHCADEIDAQEGDEARQDSGGCVAGIWVCLRGRLNYVIDRFICIHQASCIINTASTVLLTVIKTVLAGWQHYCWVLETSIGSIIWPEWSGWYKEIRIRN